MNPAVAHIERQAGVELAARLYPRGGETRLAFRQIAAHFLAEERWKSLDPSVRELRIQRVLSGTIRAVAAEDSKHGPRRLARFVVWVAKKFTEHLTSYPSKRRKAIRKQLRLSRKSASRNRQAVRRFDRVFRAILKRDDLQQYLAILVNAARGRRGVDRLKQNLEALFRHAAAMREPSSARTLEDSLALHHEELREIARNIPSNELPSAATRAALHERFITFRVSRGLKIPSDKDHKHEQAQVFDVLLRRARSQLRRSYRGEIG
ncbi:hypothetical protein LBMAG56_41430 [Verrucomicrobiota bacterium]|nr:hypothetical protein LBMAG56_41430 [Verrucomicrobiota bacterium]